MQAASIVWQWGPKRERLSENHLGKSSFRTIAICNEQPNPDHSKIASYLWQIFGLQGIHSAIYLQHLLHICLWDWKTQWHRRTIGNLGHVRTSSILICDRLVESCLEVLSTASLYPWRKSIKLSCAEHCYLSIRSNARDCTIHSLHIASSNSWKKIHHSLRW